jgi:hypothetical protein
VNLFVVHFTAINAINQSKFSTLVVLNLFHSDNIGMGNGHLDIIMILGKKIPSIAFSPGGIFVKKSIEYPWEDESAVIFPGLQSRQKNSLELCLRTKNQESGGGNSRRLKCVGGDNCCWKRGNEY